MSEEKPSEPERQHVVKVPGSRRARLTPAPGTDPAPDMATNPARGKKPGHGGGPNDERMLGDVPPHY